MSNYTTSNTQSIPVIVNPDGSTVGNGSHLNSNLTSNSNPGPTSTNNINSNPPFNNGVNNRLPADRRQPKQRFGWVRRLMQTPNKQPPTSQSSQGGPAWNQNGNNWSGSRPRNQTQTQPQGQPKVRGANRRRLDESNTIPNNHLNVNNIVNNNNNNNHNGSNGRQLRIDPNAESRSFVSFDSRNEGELEERDQFSDNISTIPLKSITSRQSTKAPSILSGNVHDENSLDASTTETSLAPSTATSNGASLTPILLLQQQQQQQFQQQQQQQGAAVVIVPPNSGATLQPNSPTTGQDRDSESIVTLASSTRRIRRRSIDTNCSTVGIAPSSIMERLTVHPTTGATSSYAVSIRTNDRASQFEPSLYDSTDQTSSLRSEHAIEV
ncbi:cell wall integrity and stress response component 2 [Scheffersomyces coipomensis]|uniref:cell wall integrity and stress response component 2 n=1 Tax=Scheffersomyces coipomensis TaxID=1788519 RepID=UPI00315D8588